MLLVYNDEDIIEEVIEHILHQQIELVVLDNGSTDKTYEICKKFLNKGILSLETYHTPTNFSDVLPMLLRMVYDLALQHSPDWVIRSDADELLESGLKGVTLKEAISEADTQGYNLIQFARFDFFMTDDDNDSAKLLKEKLRYYSCYGDFVYRAWKFFPGIEVSDAHGHYPVFPPGINYNISPRKFVLRHYPLRSKEQAERKIRERVQGITEKERNRPAENFEITKADKRHSNKTSTQLLTKYTEDGNWNYDLKYCPLLTENPPLKEDLFTSDGKLRNPPKSRNELEHEIKKMYSQKEFRLRKKINSLKNNLKKFLKN